ncbi:helix-turn-helix transcriptional regulator [Rhodococcoides yunnanense]|uniref:LuxR C-terminal-related transcriptional regulator n=1 Tax=Rhodococcoides yunnanense TaxID=278209 RepID=A0ABU4BKA8_9NOCA|nr:LuxR C-terminal-related transcriptional regulator [Rhodococcus yunnanensis]MDV6264603.1 LuxR C-terminal-related transcriptional regulator [Rhodococcus yunnanensis]
MSSTDPLDATELQVAELQVPAVLSATLAAPRSDVLDVLSRVLEPFVPHTTAVMLTGACARAPLKVSGEPLPALTASSILDLTHRAQNAHDMWHGHIDIGGENRSISVIRAGEPTAGGAAMVLVRRSSAEPDPAMMVRLGEAWNVVTVALADRAAAAPPGFAASSAFAVRERSAALARSREQHIADLTALLAVARSGRIDDAAARAEVTRLASTSMIELRRTAGVETRLTHETSTEAWDAMTAHLRLLFAHSAVELDSTISGSAAEIPLDLVQLARSTTRAIVIAMLAESDVTKVRVQWNITDDALAVVLRDDGEREWTRADVAEVDDQLAPYDSDARVDSAPGWGTTISFGIPLTLPTTTRPDDRVADMTERELEVLTAIGAGLRNREIADRISLSEHTIKFHVRRLLQKFSVRSRGELAAIAHDLGI